ncbi:OmpA family protein [Spirosoma validum]|uniref:OmpA family protein n=1 Tax=Spirosoma validum TaxID=2771355 RepID=A0A927B2X8_9BACT|nr:OmpA family protein [Spirosoma validum]MBD2754292.1 OmpA family protein [Spirosoma validum]
MTSKTPWIILLILWMIGSTWWHVCKIKHLCPDASQSNVTSGDTTFLTTPAGADGYTIADGNRFRLELPGHFSFSTSGANANMNTLGPSRRGGSLEPMIKYLKNNSGRTLEVVGYYSPAEVNKTDFPNLGLARAEGIKQYLVQQGLSAESITTKGEERNLPFAAKGDSLYGGIDFAFGGNESTETELTTTPSTTSLVVMDEPITEKELAETQKYTSVFEPIDLYFPLGEANYIKTDETKKFFDEAVKYLSSHKDKKLLLTGHTDNTGPEEANMRLSRDRANDVKSKLRKSGIESDQIEVSAKGESEPKADNKTMSGRKANRRVTVVVR